MPTYEYGCKKCGHEFEVFQSMSDAPVKVCPECGGEAERRISAGAGFIFKGSGFYSTDYRSDSYKREATHDQSSGVASETKKTTSKPAATAVKE
jgi:putative FmdB family regulatory protein